MLADDLDSADTVMRLAFGTIRGLPDPESTFGDSDMRAHAVQGCAGLRLGRRARGERRRVGVRRAVGLVRLLRPAVRPPRPLGSRHRRPAAPTRPRLLRGLGRPAGRALHLRGEPQASRPLPEARLLARSADGRDDEARRVRWSRGEYALFSDERHSSEERLLEELRALTDQIFPGLDLEREIRAVRAQGLGDTILLRNARTLEGMAVCHRGAGSEAGGDRCYVKFAAVLPGAGAGGRFERLLDACEAFTAESGAARLTAGVSSGRLDAYRRLLARGFRAEQVGVSMWLRPREPRFDSADHYVIDDLR